MASGKLAEIEALKRRGDESDMIIDNEPELSDHPLPSTSSEVTTKVTEPKSKPLPAAKPKGNRPGPKSDKPKDHICPWDGCGKGFGQKSHLTRHIKTAHKGEMVKCEDQACDKVFSTNQNMQTHFRIVHKKVKLPCRHCDKSYMAQIDLNNHVKPRRCSWCFKKDFKCATQFHEHCARHTFRCKTCDHSQIKYKRAHEHASNSHVKRIKCTQPNCKSSFTNKSGLTTHLVGVHTMHKCLMCPECFVNKATMLTHCKQNHPQHSCALCVGDEKFKFFAFKELTTHIAECHPDFFLCVKCGRQFHTFDAVKSHECSERFSKMDLELLNFLHQPININALREQNISCVFTNDDGRIVAPIPGFPHHGVCSIDSAQNATEKLRFDQFNPHYINQSQELIQLCSTAIINYCCEVNSPSYCTEVFEWQRTSDGARLPKARFDRANVRFRRDENDTLFRRPCSVLSPPYQLGHIRAAGNCLSLVDFKTSFSNLNYWPQHERLNTVHMKLLEEHIRKEAEKYKRVYITTGAIFIKDGKVVGNYCRGVFVPPAFYKLAIFETFVGKFEVFCWILHNDESDQSIGSSEVSLLLLEKATRQRFMTPDVLRRVTPESINQQLKDRRRYDTKLGVH